MDLINKFNPGTCLCLFHAKTWIPVTCHGNIVFSELRWEEIVRSVDISGIDSHQCVNLSFIRYHQELSSWCICQLLTLRLIFCVGQFLFLFLFLLTIDNIIVCTLSISAITDEQYFVISNKYGLLKLV